MKVDELLKHLENIKTDEVEKREIAESIARISSVNNLLFMYFIITKDRKMYDINSYKKLLESNKISHSDAYVYIKHNYLIEYDPVRYFYPFLDNRYFLPYAYLSKLGFNSLYAVPTPELKYISMVIRFSNVDHVVVEVANIDNVAINTNLPRIVRDILGTKQKEDDVAEIIASQLVSKKLFAGYDYYEALVILHKYYEAHDTTLAKDVEVIRDAYNRIFRPFRLEYDLNTKQFVV